MEWYGVKVENLPSLLLLPLFHPVKIDVFCTWSTNQQRDPMHSRAILFSLPSWRGSLQPFCGLFAVFCKEHGGRKFRLVHGHRVHSPLDRELDAPCRSRGTEPEEWIELVFFPFSRVIPVFPIENFCSSCSWKRNVEMFATIEEQTIEIDRNFIKILSLKINK